MSLNENEKQYYDKVVVLYSKYGENIPEADLMHLGVVEKELGISFQRSQEIFDLVKNQAKFENEETNVLANAKNKVNGSELKSTMTTSEIHSILAEEKESLIPVENPGEINKWKVIFWYTIGLFTILFWGIGLIIIIWETIIIIKHKNKQLRYVKYQIQRDKVKQ